MVKLGGSDGGGLGIRWGLRSRGDGSINGNAAVSVTLVEGDFAVIRRAAPVPAGSYILRHHVSRVRPLPAGNLDDGG